MFVFDRRVPVSLHVATALVADYPLDVVTDGMLGIYQEILGLTFEEIKDPCVAAAASSCTHARTHTQARTTLSQHTYNKTTTRQTHIHAHEAP